ncbi:MAG TPA: hypothetical protein VM910_37705 [Bradyrhizobium sp.]|jgi:hypothetical protein|nr:hypothetical protein [Bradyrhizobium sp.]
MSNGRPTMRNYLDRMHDQTLAHVASLSNSDILSKSLDEWVAQLVQEFASPEIPVLDLTKISRTAEQGEVPAYAVPNLKFSTHVPRVQGLIHHIHVPFTGDRNFFHCHPAGWVDEFPGAAVGADELILAIGGAWYTPPQIEDKIDSQIADIENALQGFRDEAERFKVNFPDMVRPALEKRRQTAEAEAQTAAGLKYPIKPRPNAPQTYVVPAVRKKIAPAPMPAGPSPDPTLLEEHYRNILNIMDNMARVMERSPSAFEKIGEEDLRWHFLLQLNAQYDGVNGEAFNFQGKTDILVRQQNHNLFIAECKYWSGQKGLLETVDQLFKYVTWRDTKTAVVMFSDRQQFTPVVKDAADTMAQHPRLVGKPKKEGETRFRYTLHIPNDKDRHITTTMMLFNVPKPT